MFVLLHGFAGTPAAWDDVLAAWPAGSPRAIALALPGHGEPAPDSWEQALDDVSAYLPGGATVVGYSLGARIALGLLERDACARAVLISVNPGLASEAERAQRRADDARWATLLRTDGVAAFAEAWEAQPLFASAARASAERRARRRAARLELDAEDLARSLETMGLAEMPDYRAILREKAARVRLVTGALDEKFCAIARGLPAPLTVLPDVGHDPTLEAPEVLALTVTSANP
jgi:2-succinyl-6-hydroxy-2,4-cyclohexadiene-1-carboxylate synthase